MPATSVCMPCGSTVEEPPILNLLPDGTPCPTCAQRLLDSLPPVLPGTSGLRETGNLSFHPEQADELDDVGAAGVAWEARHLPGGAVPSAKGSGDARSYEDEYEGGDYDGDQPA